MKYFYLSVLILLTGGLIVAFWVSPGQTQGSDSTVYLPIVSNSRSIDDESTPTPDATAPPAQTPPVSSQTHTPTPTPTSVQADVTAEPGTTLVPTATPQNDVQITPTQTPTPTPTNTPLPTPTPKTTPSTCTQYGQGIARSSRFGVQMYVDTREESKYFDSFLATRSGWVRVIAPWGNSEPQNTTPENYDWGAWVDRELAIATHIDVNVIATIGYAPGWAATNPNGELDKTSLDEFVEYVTAMVERYDGDGIDDAPCSPVVNYWQLYNEPDRGTKNNPGYFRNGWGEVPEKYADMLKAVYPAIKGANPNAQVVFGGIAYESFHLFVEDFTDGVLKAGGGDYFDIMAFHIYPEFWKVHADHPPGLYEKSLKIRKILADNGVDKPLFITETGSHSNRHASFTMTEELQARYVPQLFIQALQAGAEAVIWFMLYDTPDTFYPYQTGLVTNDDPPQQKLSFDAFRVATDALEDAEIVKIWGADEKPRDDLFVYELRKQDSGKRFFITWLGDIYSTATTEIQIEAEYVTRRDLFGIGVIVVDQADGNDDGFVTIRVGSQPIYIELP